MDLQTMGTKQAVVTAALSLLGKESVEEEEKSNQRHTATRKMDIKMAVSAFNSINTFCVFCAALRLCDAFCLVFRIFEILNFIKVAKRYCQ
jgi:hypothetical protein